MCCFEQLREPAISIANHHLTVIFLGNKISKLLSFYVAENSDPNFSFPAAMIPAFQSLLAMFPEILTFNLVQQSFGKEAFVKCCGRSSVAVRNAAGTFLAFEDCCRCRDVTGIHALKSRCYCPSASEGIGSGVRAAALKLGNNAECSGAILVVMLSHPVFVDLPRDNAVVEWHNVIQSIVKGLVLKYAINLIGRLKNDDETENDLDI